MISKVLSAIGAAIAPAMGNHLWQSTLCLFIAGLLTLILRKNHARARYGLWLAASVKFLIPFSLLIALGTHLARPRVIKPTEPGLFLTVEEVSQPFTKGPHAQERRLPPELRADWRYRLLPAVPPICAAAWLSGFLLVLAGWWRRWRRIAEALHAAEPLPDGREVQALRRVEHRAGVQKPIDLVLSPTSLEPGIFGIVRPALVWPAGISEHLQDAHLEAILAHEVWHVRRHDNLAAAIHMVVEAIFWFHPLVWWLGTRLVEEREHACDEEVLQLGGEPHVYAESILKTCQFCLESPLACVAGITGAELKARIVRIMTQRAADKLSFGRKLLLTGIGIALIAGPVVFGLVNAPQIRAQSPAVPQWETAAGGKMKFEVASVRLSPPDASTRGTDFLSPFDAPPPKRGLFSANARLLNYIAFAYKILDTSQYQPLMAHLPRWAETDQFDIEARAEGNPTKDQLRLMMQSLLEERFKLAIHTETRQRPVYALVLDKPGKLGPQLRPHPDNVPCSDKPDKPELSDSGTTPPPYCGQAGWLANGQLHERMLDVTMVEIATYVGGAAGFVGGREHLPVLDQTGLSGKFDVNIEFVKDSGGPGTDSDVWGPTFTAALRNQLGLKLMKQTGTVPVFIIDHVEKPSEN